MSDITRVSRHIGSLDELHARLPDAEVIVSARDGAAATGTKRCMLVAHGR